MEIKIFSDSIFDNVSISVSSSASNTQPEKVIDYDWNGCWFSNSAENNWLEFNFKQNRVKLNGYSIKTYTSSYTCHLRNWVIEGCNDRVNWEPIDIKKDNGDLNGNGKEHYFSISKKTDEFQFIRIRNTGIDWYNISKHLVISNIELYGSIWIDSS